MLDRSGTDEAHLIAFFLGEEGDLPPVVAGRLHADDHIGELVVKRSHEVFAEYGNVGSAVPDYAQTGFGWTNASYQVGLAMLSKELRKDLDELIPPEWVASY